MRHKVALLLTTATITASVPALADQSTEIIYNPNTNKPEIFVFEDVNKTTPVVLDSYIAHPTEDEQIFLNYIKSKGITPTPFKMLTQIVSEEGEESNRYDEKFRIPIDTPFTFCIPTKGGYVVIEYQTDQQNKIGHFTKKDSLYPDLTYKLDVNFSNQTLTYSTIATSSTKSMAIKTDQVLGQVEQINGIRCYPNELTDFIDLSIENRILDADWYEALGDFSYTEPNGVIHRKLRAYNHNYYAHMNSINKLMTINEEELKTAFNVLNYYMYISSKTVDAENLADSCEKIGASIYPIPYWYTVHNISLYNDEKLEDPAREYIRLIQSFGYPISTIQSDEELSQIISDITSHEYTWSKEAINSATNAIIDLNRLATGYANDIDNVNISNYEYKAILPLIKVRSKWLDTTNPKLTGLIDVLGEYSQLPESARPDIYDYLKDKKANQSKCLYKDSVAYYDLKTKVEEHINKFIEGHKITDKLLSETINDFCLGLDWERVRGENGRSDLSYNIDAYKTLNELALQLEQLRLKDEKYQTIPTGEELKSKITQAYEDFLQDKSDSYQGMYKIIKSDLVIEPENFLTNMDIKLKEQEEQAEAEAREAEIESTRAQLWFVLYPERVRAQYNLSDDEYTSTLELQSVLNCPEEEFKVILQEYNLFDASSPEYKALYDCIKNNHYTYNNIPSPNDNKWIKETLDAALDKDINLTKVLINMNKYALQHQIM